jgi:hypothetical protein
LRTDSADAPAAAEAANEAVDDSEAAEWALTRLKYGAGYRQTVAATARVE